ncbi:hypothetical protein ELI_0141 [Eubacterium callanderi]|uniref:Uncharacterized protein n=1 Tax=Eubacterium callanderi TaxID=53442 RepID=E3GHK8_9FIRM|nr:hypothetical protein ELI_0141 [Eubacterium callanderi]
MLIFNEVLLVVNPVDYHLNTSHVNLQPNLIFWDSDTFTYLNTSHVNLQQQVLLESNAATPNLNTSHVNLQPPVPLRCQA